MNFGKRDAWQFHTYPFLELPSAKRNERLTVVLRFAAFLCSAASSLLRSRAFSYPTYDLLDTVSCSYGSSSFVSSVVPGRQAGITATCAFKCLSTPNFTRAVHAVPAVTRHAKQSRPALSLSSSVCFRNQRPLLLLKFRDVNPLRSCVLLHPGNSRESGCLMMLRCWLASRDQRASHRHETTTVLRVTLYFRGKILYPFMMSSFPCKSLSRPICLTCRCRISTG